MEKTDIGELFVRVENPERVEVRINFSLWKKNN